MARPPGRPPLDDNDPSVAVIVRMPSRQYDDAYQQAQRDRISVPEVIRRALKEATDKRPPE